LQDILAQDVTVLTYDRAGYGWSSAGKFPRTPEQVAVELDEILNTLNLAPPYILVGHSIGGLYARQYAMMAPGKVAACVFLDPMPVENKRFEQELGPELYRQSGADKTGAMSTGKFFASTGLGRVLAPLIQSAPMFAGYKKLGKNVYPVIYENMVREESYPAMLSEYVSAMDDTQLGLVREKSRFPDIPVVVVYHSPERVVDETVRWAKLTKEDAQKVETLREKLTREYLESGKNKNKPEWVVMSNSGHYMHLDEPGVIAGIIKKCAGKERK
ncbi:MAG: alpha/beta hydrolase, partial [Elusimicrobiota bacterium]